MLNKGKKTVPAPAPVNVTITGITGTEFLIGVVILALAVVAAAAILHDGLVA